VLEQFRIFHAALRVGQFTVKQLAEASGVAEGTVQKTLRRRKDLFVSVKGPPTKRPGGQMRLHTIRADLLAAAVQKAADQPPLPKLPTKESGEPLGLILAQETLCRLLPRAAPHDRPALLSAASSHLDLATGAANSESVAEVRRLHQDLSILVDAQVWLVGLEPHVRARESWNIVLSAIEALLSLEEREERNRNLGRRQRTIDALVELPSELALFSQSAAGHLAKTPNWWLQLLAAALSLLSHERWRDVAGDLSGIEFAMAVSRQLAIVASRELVVLVPPKDNIEPNQSPPRGWMIAPTTRFLSGGKARAIARKESGIESLLGNAVAGGPFFSSGEQHGGIRVQIENRDFLVYSGPESVGPIRQAIRPHSRAVGRIAALDLDLVSRSFAYATLEADGGLGITALVSYDELELANPPESDDTRHVWIISRDVFRGSAAGLIPQHSDIRGLFEPTKIGSPQWVNYDTTRVVLRPGNRIEVFDANDFRGSMEWNVGIEEHRGKIDLASGMLIDASIKFVDRRTLNVVSFQALEYQPNRRCFVLRSMDKVSVGWPVVTQVGFPIRPMPRELDFRSH
jgi:hypothetical protein